VIAIKVTVKNLDQVLYRTQHLEEGLKNTRSLIQGIGLIIERQAKKNSSGRPGPRVRTGNLRASIAALFISSSEISIGTRVKYAPFVEFGHTVRRGLQTSARHRRNYIPRTWVPAYPFLFPAIDQTRQRVSDYVLRYVRKLLRMSS